MDRSRGPVHAGWCFLGCSALKGVFGVVLFCFVFSFLLCIFFLGGGGGRVGEGGRGGRGGGEGGEGGRGRGGRGGGGGCSFEVDVAAINPPPPDFVLLSRVLRVVKARGSN